MVLRECIIQEKLSIYSILILCYFGYATLYSDNLRVITKLLHENATSLIQLMLLVLAQYQIFDVISNSQLSMRRLWFWPDSAPLSEVTGHSREIGNPAEIFLAAHLYLCLNDNAA